MEKGIAALNKSLDELENATDITKATAALSRVLETVCGVKRKVGKYKLTNFSLG